MTIHPIHQRSAFSLTEVLLVFALIGALAVLLTGYMGRVREQSLTVRCSGNLRQIGVAMMAYMQDHQNQLPPVLNTQRTPPDSLAWMVKLRSYVGYSSDSMGSSPRPRAAGIFYCPALTDTDRSGRRVGYFYNGRITASRVYNYNQLSRERTFLIVESAPQNVEALVPNAVSLISRHGGISNVLFVQGHVEALTAIPPADAPEWGPQ